MVRPILFLNHSDLSDRDAMRFVAEAEPSMFAPCNRKHTGFGICQREFQGRSYLIDYTQDRKKRLKIVVSNASD